MITCSFVLKQDAYSSLLTFGFSNSKLPKIIASGDKHWFVPEKSKNQDDRSRQVPVIFTNRKAA